MASAPAFTPSRKASIVFSGACCEAPRWATTVVTGSSPSLLMRSRADDTGRSAPKRPADERNDRALDEGRVKAIAALRLVGDDAVHEHRNRQAELLDVDLRLHLRACHRLAQEHGGERANLVASTAQHVAERWPDVGLGPAGGDDGTPALCLQALDEKADGTG